MNTHERVLYFINLIKGHSNEGGHDAHQILEQVYSRGNCYMFAKALQFVFPEAELYNYVYFGHHVVVKIENKFYDITGEKKGLENYFSPLTKEEEKQAMTWCYSHREKNCYGVKDNDGNSIDKIESLMLNEEQDGWYIPQRDDVKEKVAI